MYITEEKEEMVLILLEQTGMTLRKLKAEIRQMCSMNKYVKSSTIYSLCDRIENEQRICKTGRYANRTGKCFLSPYFFNQIVKWNRVKYSSNIALIKILVTR